MGIVSILLNILMLDIIIFCHELGHFLLAKANDMVVTEFSIGFGPRILSFKKGETRYSLKLILLGGSCAIDGMIDDPEINEGEINERSFVNKSILSRFLVIAAGPVFNFILAFILALIMVGSVGSSVTEVKNVNPGSPAAEAGLMPGDVITKLGNKKISTGDLLVLKMQNNGSRPVKIQVKRNNEKITKTLTPKFDGETGRYLMGIEMQSKLEKVKGAELIADSAGVVKNYTDLTFTSLKMLITGKASIKDMVGPIGLTTVVNDTVKSSMSSGSFYIFMNMLNLTILISINLGIINLFPLPALDGGRIILLIYEAIAKRKLDTKYEMAINSVGFYLIIALSLFVILNDIKRFF